MIKNLPLYWIDAFAAAAFQGNPAAVVPLDTWLPEAVMQAIAFENGLAETAFLVPLPDSSLSEPHYQLRWFTPRTEVDLCGHATLASGHVVLRELGHAAPAVTFESRSGPLTVAIRGDRLELDFPATPVADENDANVREAVVRALGAAPVWLGRSCFDRFAVVASARQVREISPLLEHVAAAGGRGLIVTAPGDDCDFVSRFFAPQVGIAEDPVTGSAHCALVPYWSQRLRLAQLHARQLSHRGGELWCEAVGDQTSRQGRVKIAGQTVMYLHGDLRIDA